MPEQKTDLEQLCGMLSQFDKTTILSAVARVVPRRDLVQLGIGGAGTGMLVIPPVILYPGGAVAPGETEELMKSTDCGPKEVKATEKGDWSTDKTVARASAQDAARTAAAKTCRGDCPDRKPCNYLEKKNSIVGPEERQDPQNPNVTFHRYECTSEGTCQCE